MIEPTVKLLPYKWRPYRFALTVSWADFEARTAFHSKLNRILSSWEGTPYQLGRQEPGAGVDCVRFLCAVLDEMKGIFTSPAILPMDTAMHRSETAVTTMLQIMQLYQPNAPVYDGTIEPGDVLIVGPGGWRPRHAMLVGPQPNTLWHAGRTGVHRTGLGLNTLSGWTKVFRVYRCTDREKWS